VGIAQAESSQTFSHVLVVWLKQPGDAKMRQKFIAASERMNSLPGIISRHVGFVEQSDRNIVDDSFDVAVTVTLKDKAAYELYMAHPLHKEIVERDLKPLVDKLIAYDFVSK
jgi:hypothetical protein